MLNDDDKLRNPWRVHVPTMTAKSSVAIRYVDKDRGLQIRRLHEIEMMNLIGWDAIISVGPFARVRA